MIDDLEHTETAHEAKMRLWNDLVRRWTESWSAVPSQQEQEQSND